MSQRGHAMPAGSGWLSSPDDRCALLKSAILPRGTSFTVAAMMLAGRAALVTGEATGTGAAIARVLAEKGGAMWVSWLADPRQRPRWPTLPRLRGAAGRLFATAAVFLASPAAVCIHSQIPAVDGRWMAR